MAEEEKRCPRGGIKSAAIQITGMFLRLVVYTNHRGEGGPVIETAVYGPLCLPSFLPEDENASLNSEGAGGTALAPSQGRKAQYKATFLSHQEN